MKKHNEIYRNANPDKCKSATLAWIDKNKESIKAKKAALAITRFESKKEEREKQTIIRKQKQLQYAKEWRLKNPDLYKAQIARHRIKNAESIRERKKIWSTKNKDKITQYHASYALKNKDIINQRSAIYRKNNPEKEAARQARQRIKHKDRISKNSAEWRAKNPTKIRELGLNWRSSNPDYHAKWRESNKGLERIYKQNRRARAKQSGGALSNGLTEKLYNLQKGKCACCGSPLGDKFHLDHIMPLALGGSNTDDNIQLLLPKCNTQKRAKHPIDFMQQKGFLL